MTSLSTLQKNRVKIYSHNLKFDEHRMPWWGDCDKLLLMVATINNKNFWWRRQYRSDEFRLQDAILEGAEKMEDARNGIYSRMSEA